MRDEGSSLPQSDQLPAGVRFTELAPGLLLIVAAVAVYAVVDARTPAGFETRVTGWGPRFAQYAGIDRPALTVRLLACSGGLAGVVGAGVGLGFPHRRSTGAPTL